MTTKELFEKVISKKNWYESLGFSANHAWMLKKKFKEGTLAGGSMYEILVRLGYECQWAKKVKGA